MDLSSIDLNQAGMRIRERRRELGMTQGELSGRVSLSAASVSKYENGKVTEASAKAFTEFANALGVPVWWLLGAEAGSGSTKAKRVPVIGKSAAGAPIFAIDEFDEFAFVGTEENVDFAVRVEGDSMVNARIFDGDLVFASRQPTVSNGDIAIVVIDEGPEESYVTTKRFYKYGATIVLRSENPAYSDIEISKKSGKNVRVIGRVVFLKGIVR